MAALGNELTLDISNRARRRHSFSFKVPCAAPDLLRRDCS